MTVVTDENCYQGVVVYPSKVGQKKVAKLSISQLILQMLDFYFYCKIVHAVSFLLCLNKND